MGPGALQNWNDLFVAEVGASAALAGLLMVAVSINLARILEFPALPVRVVEALVALLSVLVIGTLGLVPGQSARVHGIEFGLVGLGFWVSQTRVLYLTRQKTYGRFVARACLNQAAPILFVASGAIMAAGHPWGVYVLVPGILLAFTAGLFGAWVLLIEILR